MPEESRTALSRTDPHGPLIIDTRDLGRRPGTMREQSRTVPAPADLGIDVIGVPEGAALRLDIRLESVMEGVLASGTAWATLSGECVRCLDPIERELEVDFQELYAYPESDADDEVLRLEGTRLDLEPMVRDAVVLALPLQPVCREDCPGLCPDCGERLADVSGHQHGPAADPRWAVLQELLDGSNGSSADPSADESADEKRDD